MEHFLHRSGEVDYSISEYDYSCGEIALEDVYNEDGLNSFDHPLGRSINEKPDFEKLFQLNFEQVDEIDKLNSANLLVESTMRLTANVTEQNENATTLLKANCNLLAHIKVLF